MKVLKQDFEHQAPCVFDYTDPFIYFSDYIEFMKATKAHWSVGSWASQLGLSSTSALGNILKGRRSPDESFLNQLVESMSLPHYEADFLLLLLIKNAKKNSSSTIELTLREKIASLKPKGAFRQLDEKEFQKVCLSYHYAIREMINLSDFKEDSSWIKSRLVFNITEGEVKEAIDRLLEVRLLKRNDERELEICEEFHSTTNDISKEEIKNFHCSMLDLAKNSLVQDEVNIRHIVGNTLCINKEDIPRFKKHLELFRRETSFMFDTKKGSEVYQLNIQLFPLTKKELS